MISKTFNDNIISRILAFLILLIFLFMVNCGRDETKKIKIENKQILLISIDTLRADHLSVDGYFRDTSPHLAQLISDSTYYEQAYPNGCWTMPSHMSLLTGTLPSRHGINKSWHSVKIKKIYSKPHESLHNIAEILKSHHVHTVKMAGLPDELGFARGFDVNYKIDPFSNEKDFYRLINELEKSKDKEFFFFIHTWMVHAPYANSHFLSDNRLEKDKIERINNFRTNKKLKVKSSTKAFKNMLVKDNLYNKNDCITLYDSCIRDVDNYIGKLIDRVKRLGIYKNLMIIVVSDHGEHFAEHYGKKFYNFHGSDFYEEFVDILLAIKYPYKFKAKKESFPVSLIDVFPTILDFYDIKIPLYIQGHSLLVPPDKKNSHFVVSEAISNINIERKMIRLGNLKYIITMRNAQNKGRLNFKSIFNRRLYDLKTDPAEKKNLYKDLKYRKLCIELEKILIKKLKNSIKNNFHVKKTKIGKETLKQLEALGYL